MRGALSAILLFSLLGLAGCSGIVGVSGFFNPGMASGVVSIVHFIAIGDGGIAVNVTAVTLTNSGSAQDFTFCGNQTSFFPMNTFVDVTFNPGQNCSTVVSVFAH
ncbi:MAG TPA: hypothetical protein VK473_05950 [Terriglobales bacterium]|nr:hypothetical protein [Terriglobales bacterium]